MLRSLLLGTLGTILQVILGFAGFGLFVIGMLVSSTWYIIGAVVCLGVLVGIAYALWHARHN